jgi:hypothetical protein
MSFIANFNILSLSSEAFALYDLINNFIQSSDETIVEQVLSTYIDDNSYEEDNSDDPDFVPDPPPTPLLVPYVENDLDSLADYEPMMNLDSLTQFATDANIQYPELNIALPLDSDPDTALSNVLASFGGAGVDIYEAIFNLYIINSESTDATFQNLNDFFYGFFKLDTVSVTKDFLIPRIIATLQIIAGIEVPRSILLPLDLNNQVIPDINTKLIFDIGDLFFDSKGSFGFDNALSLSFSATPKAQIANSGLIISFTGAILDMSTTTNIPEADAAGYSVDFVGLFLASATISLNTFGTNNSPR